MNIERPDTYLIGRVLFHLRLLGYLLPRLSHYDFIFFHPVSALWLFPLRLMGRDRPLLVMDSRDLLDTNVTTLKARLRNSWERFSYRLAAKIIDGQTAITPRLANLVGIPPEQLWGIWPSGVAPEAFDVSRASRQWPTADEPVRLVYAGIFLEQRNLLPLARAVKRANDEGAAFVLSLYGDGPLRAALEAEAAESAVLCVSSSQSLMIRFRLCSVRPTLGSHRCRHWVTRNTRHPARLRCLNTWRPACDIVDQQ